MAAATAFSRSWATAMVAPLRRELNVRENAMEQGVRSPYRSIGRSVTLEKIR
jgi:hypothetical protein